MKDLMRLVRNYLFPSDERRLQSLRITTKHLMPNYRLTWPQMGWWDNEQFNSFLDKFDERLDGMNTHRRWTITQLMRLTIDIPGDTAECGVYKGAGSWLICDFKKRNKIPGKHYLFDSFQGLNQPGSLDGNYWNSGDMAVDESSALANLEEFSSMIDVKKGWIPERFNEVAEVSFSFVHVDVDLAEPTRESIAFFYDRLNNGAVFLCDDYGFTSCPGVTVAIDKFLGDKPEKMISLDAGGGFFLKGVATADQYI